MRALVYNHSDIISANVGSKVGRYIMYVCEIGGDECFVDLQICTRDYLLNNSDFTSGRGRKPKPHGISMFSCLGSR